jgi:hypothetical protein
MMTRITPSPLFFKGLANALILSGFAWAAIILALYFLFV